MITLQSQLNDQSDRLDTHSELLSNILQRIKLLEESGASSQEPGDAAGTWTRSSSRLPDSYRMLIVHDGCHVMYAVYELGRWIRMPDGASLNEPKFWMYAPEFPKETE